MNRLAGKTALITGAAQGMGAQHARRFIGEGANVVLTDVQAEKGQLLAEELGEQACFTHHDVSDEAHWENAVNLACSRFGAVNILVNNAAMYKINAVDKETPENVRQMLDINLFGCWLGITKVAPVMRECGGGSIVNISSLAGCSGIPRHSIYGATKWGVRGLTKSSAYDLSADNIRVNAVLPGAVADTGMHSGGNEATMAAIPMGRAASPDEISNLVIFLASDESSYITGADHVIDGGRGLW